MPTGTVSGYIRDARTTNAISGANISISGDGSTTSGSNGYYSKTLSYGTYTFTVSATNYQTQQKSVTVDQSSESQDFNLSPG